MSAKKQINVVIFHQIVFLLDEIYCAFKIDYEINYAVLNISF